MPFATPLTPLLAAAFEIPLFFLPADPQLRSRGPDFTGIARSGLRLSPARPGWLSLRGRPCKRGEVDTPNITTNGIYVPG
jgi:hypothetical protein